MSGASDGGRPPGHKYYGDKAVYYCEGCGTGYTVKRHQERCSCRIGQHLRNAGSSSAAREQSPPPRGGDSGARPDRTSSHITEPFSRPLTVPTTRNVLYDVHFHVYSRCLVIYTAVHARASAAESREGAVTFVVDRLHLGSLQ